MLHNFNPPYVCIYVIHICIFDMDAVYGTILIFQIPMNAMFCKLLQKVSSSFTLKLQLYDILVFMRLKTDLLTKWAILLNCISCPSSNTIVASKFHVGIQTKITLNIVYKMINTKLLSFISKSGVYLSHLPNLHSM